jgi:hypothetical protein
VKKRKGQRKERKGRESERNDYAAHFFTSRVSSLVIKLINKKFMLE